MIMKDQRNLLLKCVKKNIPTFILIGDDPLALNTLSYYRNQAQLSKCSMPFLYDLVLLIKDFNIYQLILEKQLSETKLMLNNNLSVADQKRMTANCVYNELPIFVICGDDTLALPTLKYYQSLLSEEEEIKIMEKIICSFISYPQTKVPGLTPDETQKILVDLDLELCKYRTKE